MSEIFILCMGRSGGSWLHKFVVMKEEHDTYLVNKHLYYAYYILLFIGLSEF